jgi:hypothetical protein
VTARVKVYRPTDGGKWDDQGTRCVSIEYIEVHFCADICLPRLLISFITYSFYILMKLLTSSFLVIRMCYIYLEFLN